jgi:hypothetical protein
MNFTHTEIFLGALDVTPVGDRTSGMCSTDTPVMYMLAISCITTAPLEPLNAQHWPGRTLAYNKVTHSAISVESY